jgi:hypothetical protein
MPDAKSYREKAAEHLLLAEAATQLAARAEELRLALSYLRLADLAEKNSATDVVYETPPRAEDPQSREPI